MKRIVVSALLILLLSSPAADGAAGQAEPEAHTVLINGFEMVYETVGRGEPLLLVHGWSGNAEYFGPLLADLRKHYRLTIPELRGHGRSTNPGGSFTIKQASRDVGALLRHLGLQGVRAMGASAGGLTLLDLSIQDPTALEKMILVGVGTHFPPHCKESMAASDAGSYSDAWWDVMRDRHGYGDDQIRAIIGYLQELAATDGDVAFTPELLATVEARTFIVQGDSDWCFPPPLVAEMHQAIPDAILWVIPEGEHVPILGERAPLFLELALEFFSEPDTAKSKERRP
jgi:pimeloyl-ACP methyl ester carboxylesterase